MAASMHACRAANPEVQYVMDSQLIRRLEQLAAEQQGSVKSKKVGIEQPQHQHIDEAMPLKR